MHARLAAPPAPESFADVKPPHSGARCVRLGDGRVVYQEASHEDWLLVTLGVGVCSSMSVVLMMLFSGYCAV